MATTDSKTVNPMQELMSGNPLPLIPIPQNQNSMKRYKKTTLTLLLLTVMTVGYGQIEKKQLTIVSYNVENFFDTVDDPDKNDEEYLVGGLRGWNKSKYMTKQSNISKVISTIGGWTPPAIVGLLEVESDRALRDLTRYAPLKNLKYKYIHYESPDRRGIDVALLYQPDQFKPFHQEPIEIVFADTTYKTRDLLYVAGTIPNQDTLHIFLCHFPSRWGGELESENRRVEVAQTLRNKIDDLYAKYERPYIVVMGDFNDEPTNNSMLNVLQAKKIGESVDEKSLYNLSFSFVEKGEGTHKYQGEWGMLDQIIVSGNLLQPTQQTFTTSQDMHIYAPHFLLEDDETYLGKKPFRTYIGMRYNGGFADHLPVYLHIWY